MKLKLFFTIIGICLICGFAFPDEERRAGEMSLYINPIGLGFGKDIASISALGLTYEYYFLDWLSVDGGFLFKLNIDLNYGFPGYILFPISVHANIPKAEWLIAGLGFSFDIPLFCAMPPNVDADGNTWPDAIMAAFFAIHADIGFDLKNVRILFRVSRDLARFNQGYRPEKFIVGALLQIQLMRRQMNRE